MTRTLVRTSLVAAALAAVCAVTAAGAAADGGPAPGPLAGWKGVVAPSGSERYVTLPAGPRTVVAAVSTRDGTVVRFRDLRGAWGIPAVAWDGTADGLSADGRTLVLAQWLRPGQRSTRFAVLDPRRLRPRRRVVLAGAFSFDAVSPDGRTIYLIEYVAAQDATRYRVRAYDLAARRLLPQPIVDKREPDEPMIGAPITRAWSQDRAWAYTLYRRDGAKPFIHALDTTNRRAVCIDLPWRGSQDALWRVRLTLSADQTKLVLQRRGGGDPVAVVDTRTFRVTRG